MILRLENTTTHQEYQYDVVDVNNGEKLYFRFNINTLDLDDGEYTIKVYDGDELILTDILKIGDFNANSLQYKKSDNTYIEVELTAKIQEKEVDITDIATLVKPDSGFDGMSSVFVDAQPLYDAAYIEGYDEGREDGEAVSFDLGFEAGVKMQKAKLESISITENGTYTKEDGYNNVVVNVPDLNGAYSDGYDDGIVDGKEIGYNQGYGIGIEEGYQNGLTEGTEAGYNSGYTTGIEIGTETGFASGYSQGKDEGKSEGIQLQKSKLESITITENGTITREDGYNSITVEVPDLNGSYNDGYNDGINKGINDQKAKLETISITENGTYTKEDGFKEVVVNVADENGSFDEGYTSGYTQGASDGYNQGYEEGSNSCSASELYDIEVEKNESYSQTIVPEEGKDGFSSVEIKTGQYTANLIEEFGRKGDSIYITNNGYISVDYYNYTATFKRFINDYVYLTSSHFKYSDELALHLFFTPETIEQKGCLIGGGGFAIEIGDGYIWARYGDHIGNKIKIYPNIKLTIYMSDIIGSIPFFQTSETLCIGGYNEGNGVITNKTSFHFSRIDLGSYRYTFNSNDDKYLNVNGNPQYIEDLEIIVPRLNSYPFNFRNIEVAVETDLSQYQYSNFTFYSYYDYNYFISNYSLDFVSFENQEYGVVSEYIVVCTKIDDETYKYQYFTKDKTDKVVVSYFFDYNEKEIKRFTFKNVRVHFDSCAFNSLTQIDLIENLEVAFTNITAPLQRIVFKYTSDEYSDYTCYGNSLFGDDLQILREYDNYSAQRFYESLSNGYLVDNNLIIID